MESLVMFVVMCLSCGVAAYYRWKAADLRVELDAALEESMRRQRLLENEMVKSGNLRATNLELVEKVKRLMAQPQQTAGVVLARVPRTIYFN